MKVPETQYDPHIEGWESQFGHYNTISNKDFWALIPDDLKGLYFLDLGCGDGSDLKMLSARGALVSGVDSSLPMCMQARSNCPEADVRCESFTDPSFHEESYDWVVSKWALQTTPDYDRVYKVVERLLKPKSTFLFLVVHPFRQFLEKKAKRGGDYFKKEIVESVLFDGKVTVMEPTHTMQEILSPCFFEHFDLEVYREAYDNAAEIIDEHHYPSYVLIKAKKRA